MGVMAFAKNRCWGDYPQDVVSDWLKSFGYSYEKHDTYTNIQFKTWFKRAWTHKSMFKQFASAFKQEVGRKPLKSEYRHHIVFGLGSPKILKLKKKKRRK